MANGSPTALRGRSCAVAGVGLGRYAIELHVRPLGRTQAVVHAVAPGRVVADAIGRVRRKERGRRSVEQPHDVLGVGAVPAQQTMLAEDPQLARLDVGLLGWLGHLVGIGQSSLWIVA